MSRSLRQVVTAPPEIDLVAATEVGDAVGAIAPCGEGEDVAAPPAAQNVVAGPTIDGVAARPAAERVVA